MSVRSNVLVVCTGNICRSPLGEAALRGRLDGVVVASAGTDAQDGGPATEGSRVAGGERGLDLSTHRSRRLTVGMVEEAALVIGMERAHRDAIARAVPTAAARTFTLKELVLLLEAGGPPTGSLAERVAEAARRRAASATRSEDLDVADPYGAHLDAYRRTADEIASWTDRLAALLGAVPVPAAERA